MADPEKEKLDELGDEIAAARRQAQQDGLIESDDEDTFVDSGARPQDDDQTIAPG